MQTQPYLCLSNKISILFQMTAFRLVDLLSKIKNYLFAYGCLYAYKFVYHMYSWYSQEPEMASGALETELQTIVSCHVGAGNKTLVLCESSLCP